MIFFPLAEVLPAVRPGLFERPPPLPEGEGSRPLGGLRGPQGRGGRITEEAGGCAAEGEQS